jgi:hypothetical protein
MKQYFQTRLFSILREEKNAPVRVVVRRPCKRAGVLVFGSILQQECHKCNEGFRKKRKTQRRGLLFVL